MITLNKYTAIYCERINIRNDFEFNVNNDTILQNEVLVYVQIILI